MKQQNMKHWSLNMKQESFRFLVIVGFFVFIACGSESSGDPAKLVVNTWKLSEFTPADRFPMPDSVRLEIIAKTVLTFTADGKFTQTGISRKHSGTYSVSEDGKQITYYHDERNVPFTETVLELTSKRMKVVDQNGNRMVRTN
jgi:hypothetical protein